MELYILKWELQLKILQVMQQDITRREMEKRLTEILNSSLLRQILMYLAVAALGAILLLNLHYLISFIS